MQEIFDNLQNATVSDGDSLVYWCEGRDSDGVETTSQTKSTVTALLGKCWVKGSPVKSSKPYKSAPIVTVGEITKDPSTSWWFGSTVTVTCSTPGEVTSVMYNSRYLTGDQITSVDAGTVVVEVILDTTYTHEVVCGTQVGGLNHVITLEENISGKCSLILSGCLEFYISIWVPITLIWFGRPRIFFRV